KWQLGKQLFFDDVIQMEKAERLFSCASCHNPAHGFAENAAVSQYMNRNALSLINVVYNRRQFWDGRSDVLEATILREQHEDATRTASDLAKKHNFVELGKSLRGNEKYRKRFQDVFGIPEPTPDAAAKALATYLRTILSGNSVIDRAEHERGRKKGLVLTPEHFRSVLAADDLGALGGVSAKEAAERLEQGYRLFTGKAQCSVCHPLNGLFTDQDFHNIGLRQERVEFELGNVEGRIATVPIGLKEPRLVGAFRTPSLRALTRTGPYMHDGSKDTLTKVVEHFNSGVSTSLNPYVARQLVAGPNEPRRLNLDEGERRALVLFLEALDGGPVDPIVSGPPAKPIP